MEIEIKDALNQCAIRQDCAERIAMIRRHHEIAVTGQFGRPRDVEGTHVGIAMRIDQHRKISPLSCYDSIGDGVGVKTREKIVGEAEKTSALKRAKPGIHELRWPGAWLGNRGIVRGGHNLFVTS